MDHRNTLRGLFPFDSAYLPEIADVWVESWQRTMPSIDFETRRAWLVDHLIAADDAGQTIRCALVETGEIAGFVLIDTSTGYLDQIVVGSPWWGKGIAEALLDEARRLAPGRIELDVNQDNPRAVAFYMRNGFQVIAEGMNAKSGLATLKLEWRPAAQAADPS